jgi:RAD51-like protein 2
MTGALTKKYTSGSTAMDEILEGGLKRGTILEISGPPGVATQKFAINFAKEFIKDGQGVIFVGQL